MQILELFSIAPIFWLLLFKRAKNFDFKVKTLFADLKDENKNDGDK